ncbi:hypothetical protein QUF74_18545, partial [Candidatus Halobeggiatoa sp. HSG11]|nr:hypothetical protein [Candidatus Halobeggiatoa sp. HSG11]
ATFTAEDVALIPPEALSELQAVQIATMKGLEGLTIEQFAEIPIIAFSGLTSENIRSLPVEVLNKFTSEHIEILNESEFKTMPSEDIAKFFVNTDFANIGVINRLVPKGWTLDSNTGKFVAPINSKLVARYILPKPVNLPYIIDMHRTIGIGGYGKFSLLQATIKILKEKNLPDFVLSQDKNGIFLFKDVSSPKIKNYTFIPDIDSIIQINTALAGWKISNGGFYNITTLEGLKYRIIPAPKDPIALSKIIGNEIRIGKQGDVFMEVPEQTRRGNNNFMVAIFDPFIEPSPESWCVENLDEMICDFDNVPMDMQPGIHFSRERAKLKIPEAKVMYEDGSSQNISPTVYSPETFIKEALKFKGVEKVIFNMNGTFYVLHEGREYIVMPSFNVQTDSKVSVTKIELNEQGGVSYSVPVELPNKTRRDNRIMLMFDLFIEQAPESWCVEVDGEDGIFCDFSVL